NPIFAIATKEIQNTARKRGYSILLGSTEYSYDTEFEVVSLFHEKRVEGDMKTLLLPSLTWKPTRGRKRRSSNRR
ncbi:MAG: hypothetical protein NTW71_14790, partial [Deltaproteobacteria bacterium]|nr:hypothetical protein [Deltaproteobacteria bacterium]